MTANTLEQRARELLAAEYEREGLDFDADIVRQGSHCSPQQNTSLRAIEAALRLSAGADWALVPREPTEAMCTAHAMYGDTSDWWQAVIAAAPRHEPGDGFRPCQCFTPRDKELCLHKHECSVATAQQDQST